MAPKTRSPLRRLLVVTFLTAAGFVAGDVLAPTPATATPCNFYKCMYGGPGQWWCSWSGATSCLWAGENCSTVSCSGGPGLCGELPCTE